MATHADIGNAFAEPEDGALQRRFLGACLVKAGAIVGEDPQTANHAARLSWAMNILSQDYSFVTSKVRLVKNYALSTNADVQFDPTNVLDASITQAIEDAIAAGLV
jgi:hypothetical protein